MEEMKDEWRVRNEMKIMAVAEGMDDGKHLDGMPPSSF